MTSPHGIFLVGYFKSNMWLPTENKIAPYSDSHLLTNMMQCVTKSMLFFTPVSMTRAPPFSEK